LDGWKFAKHGDYIFDGPWENFCQQNVSMV